MSVDRPSIQERLRTAFSSHDLTMKMGRRGDADYLAALGAAGRRTGGLSGILMRINLAGSPGDYRSARTAVVALTRRMATRLGWKISVNNQRRVAEHALEHYLSPACPTCSGRGYEVAAGAPVLTGKSCDDCHGTGRRPIQARHYRYIVDVMAELERVDASTEGAVRELMR